MRRKFGKNQQGNYRKLKKKIVKEWGKIEREKLEKISKNGQKMVKNRKSILSEGKLSLGVVNFSS